jgi:hypothetical protein
MCISSGLENRVMLRRSRLVGLVFGVWRLAFGNHQSSMPKSDPSLGAENRSARRLFLHPRVAVLLVGMAFLFSAAVSRAQVENLIYTVGTSIDSSGQTWAYVSWQATDPQVLRGPVLAVYAKPGLPASPGDYVRKSVVTQQTDPAVIQVLLQRSVRLGENLDELEAAVTAAFQDLMPGGNLDLAHKLSIVIRGSLDHEHFDNLYLLSRMHPGVDLCLGWAYTDVIPPSGKITYEIRHFDPAQNQDLTVVGRVTVTPGAPLVLPGPGQPVVLPEATVTGDLNLKLRWAMPPELRRLSMVQYGCNVYRLPKAVAEASQYQLTPPTPAALQSLVASGAARQVNEVPVLPAKIYESTAEAANFDPLAGGDAQTYFVSDDGRRTNPNGQPFANGEEFYYFVTARDLLGRDGMVSPGGYAKACDRLPPEAPTGLAVANDYSYVSVNPFPPVTNQVLKLTWTQPPNTNTNELITAYYVYRWDNAGDALVLGNDPNVHLIAGPIPYANGQSTLSYLDNGQGPYTILPANPPRMPQDAGRTFWYTVRTADNGACGSNFSPHSAPVYGVLRDREGPSPARSARASIQCSVPETAYQFALPLAWPDADVSQVGFQVACTRDMAGAEMIQWAEFYAEAYLPSASPPSLTSNFLGRVYFPPTFTPNDVANRAYYLPRTDIGEGSVVAFGCRVGTSADRISEYSQGPISLEQFPQTNQFLGVLFDAHLIAMRGDGCGYHEPSQPGTNEIAGVDISFLTSPTTREYKIFRRVGSGSLTLIKQGTTTVEDPTAIQYEDKKLPPGPAQICYYVQLFDAHGNPGALTLIKCIKSAGTKPLPKPMLVPLEPSGTASEPTLKIAWVCPPYGVERFQVHIATENGVTPENDDNQFALDLSPNTQQNPSTLNEIITVDGVNSSRAFKTYLTPQIGPAFGNGAEFVVDARVDLDRKYYVMVQAVGQAGSTQNGPMSEGRALAWHEPKTALPLVPWPARALPEVSGFHPDILARQMDPTIFKGMGVRIGSIKCFVPRSEELCVPPLADPMQWIYQGNSNAQPLFPVMLYRYQVPNLFYPQVSGDVVQVSPLMESIPYIVVPIPNTTQTITQILDPFCRYVYLPATGIYELYLLDTQPVVINASYRYLLVRFDPQTKEPIQVIPTNPVTVLTP